MRRNAIFCGLICLAILGACDKHDPILPGVRTSIFNTSQIKTTNAKITSLPDVAFEMPETECPYRLDSNNTIWNGNTKIFTGFPTTNSVKNDSKPICSGKFIYAGLTTGELVKINSKSRQIVWIADIYRPSNMTGGASILDIVAPIVLRDEYVYVGGLGDAFCKVSATSGVKKWCVEIGTSEQFVIAGDVIFVVGTDNKLYALRDSDGAAFWTYELKRQTAPIFENGIIRVGRESVDAMSGEKIKE